MIKVLFLLIVFFISSLSAMIDICEPKEYPNPPSNLLATLVDDDNKLTWIAPDCENNLFSHTLTNLNMLEGVGSANTNEWFAVHRYSEALLQNLGINGLSLTQVKFLPFRGADFLKFMYGLVHQLHSFHLAI